MEGLKNRHHTHPLKGAQPRDRPLTVLRGVGPARAERFERKGIGTVLDLLLYTPTRYEDRTRFTPVSELTPDRPALVKGRAVAGGEVHFRRRRGQYFRILIQDRTGRIELVWFHYRRAHLQGLVDGRAYLAAYGRVQRSGGMLRMAHPDLRPMSPSSNEEPPGIHPVYPAVDGVPDGVLRAAIRRALEGHAPDMVDPVPPGILERLGLPPLKEALVQVHRPSKETSLEALNRFGTSDQLRLLFDRFLCVMLSLAALRASRIQGAAVPVPFSEDALEEIEARFPFRFTPGQKTAVRDLVRDMARPRPMQRLVMGDVGCGKTAVAAAAVILCVRSGGQAALMAPTRLLAEQHAVAFESLSGAWGLRTGLVTGSVKGAEREGLLAAIARGDIDLVIGTHALVQAGVAFRRLGLVVIDEQQRFGVRARGRLVEKGESPHLLVMTATPIPRTLAMTAYGDLDLSVIRDLPEGRLPVETRVVEKDGKKVLAEYLAERMTAGEQVIVVCPAVEASEDTGLKDVESMARGLKRLYANRFQVGVVHGRLAEEERLRVMERFRRGAFPLLVATTVVEVGMDVPNATVMVIEHPERFGLSQLHQLRGRVGRGRVKGSCFLVPSPELSGYGVGRLETLVRTNDGFEIAEQDLLMRGQGELTGLRQAGSGDLDLQDVLAHPHLLQSAREASEEVLRDDPRLEQHRHALLRRMVDAFLSP